MNQIQPFHCFALILSGNLIWVPAVHLLELLLLSRTTLCLRRPRHKFESWSVLQTTAHLETRHPYLDPLSRWSLWPSGRQSTLKHGEGFWVALLQRRHLRKIQARTGKQIRISSYTEQTNDFWNETKHTLAVLSLGRLIWAHGKHRTPFVQTVMWSASPLALMAHQVSDSADKRDLHAAQNRLSPCDDIKGDT